MKRSEDFGSATEGSTARTEAPASNPLSAKREAEVAVGYEMGDSVTALAQEFGVSEDYVRECIDTWGEHVKPIIQELRERAAEMQRTRPVSAIERMIDKATGYKP